MRRALRLAPLLVLAGGRGWAVRRALRLAPLLVLATLCADAAHAADPDAILGTWLAEDRYGNRDGIVEIRREGGVYVGDVVWSRYAVYPPEDPRGMAGQPVTDRENPDPALRDRPVVGIRMLSGLRFDGEAWLDGRLYSPRQGASYGAEVRLAGPDALAVRGYLGSPFFGKTVTWTRATPPDARSATR